MLTTLIAFPIEKLASCASIKWVLPNFELHCIKVYQRACAARGIQHNFPPNCTRNDGLERRSRHILRRNCAPRMRRQLLGTAHWHTCWRYHVCANVDTLMLPLILFIFLQRPENISAAFKWIFHSVSSSTAFRRWLSKNIETESSQTAPRQKLFCARLAKGSCRNNLFSDRFRTRRKMFQKTFVFW